MNTSFLTTIVETPQGTAKVESTTVTEGNLSYTKTTATYSNGKPVREGRFPLSSISTDATAIKDHEALVARIANNH